MSLTKRRRIRLEDPLIVPINELQNETSLIPMNSHSHQPIVLGPVVDNAKQLITENSQIHIMNNSSILATNPNGHSNTFIVLPQENGADNLQTILQSIPVYLLVPQQESGKVLSTMPSIKLVTEPEIQSVDKNIQAPIIIKDVRTIKNEEEENANYPDPLELSDEVTDNSDLIIIDDTVKSTSQSKEDNLKQRTMFKCDFVGCSETFLYSHEKKLHRDVHMFPSVTDFKCSICNMKFKCAIDRNKHVETHAVPSTYKCQVCKAGFPYYTTLIQHLNEKCSKNKTFPCGYCNILFASKADVVLHEQTLHLSCIIKKKFTRVKSAPPKSSDNVIVLD